MSSSLAGPLGAEAAGAPCRAQEEEQLGWLEQRAFCQVWHLSRAPPDTASVRLLAMIVALSPACPLCRVSQSATLKQLRAAHSAETPPLSAALQAFTC